MKLLKGVGATTHVDSHGDRLEPAAIRRLADQGNRAYVPFLVNHDPRVAPAGRLVSSTVEQLEDGELSLNVEAEIFEDGDEIQWNSDGRRISSELLVTNAQIVYDATFGDPELQTAIKKIASILGVTATRRYKKAHEPLSVLTFCLGALSGPVLSALGQDVYSQVKRQLGVLLRPRETEQVFVVQFQTEHAGRTIQIEIFMTNPTLSDLDEILDRPESAVQNQLEPFTSQSGVVRVVAEYSNGKINPKFALRADGVPFDSAGRVVGCRQELTGGLSISFGSSE
jgi:hypothetical protein